MIYAHIPIIHAADGKKFNIGKLAKDVFNKKNAAIPQDLFNSNALKLIEGVGKEYNFNVKYLDKDIELHRELASNVAVFSAFKSYRMTGEMQAMLLDDQGNKKSFVQFKKDVEAIDATYNLTWLNTEYNLAIRQGRAASDWNKYQQTKDVYPNIKYIASRAANQRDAHKAYYGMVKPVDDPIWDTAFPPNGFGCKCSSQQTRDDADTVDYPALETIAGIAGNAGKQKRVFSPSHPNVTSAKANGGAAIVLKALPKLLQNLPDTYTKHKAKIGTIKVHNQHDPSDFESNFASCQVVADNFKGEIEIRKHVTIDGVKNPELSYKKVIGDRAEWKTATTADKWIKSVWKQKTNNTNGQFKGLDEYFMLFDFKGKLTNDNIDVSLRKLNGQLMSSKRCVFVILQNNDKVFIIDKTSKINPEKAKKALI
jgi:hypothetical protein